MSDSSLPPLIDESALAAALGRETIDIPAIRRQVRDSQSRLCKAFSGGADITALVRGRAAAVDAVLVSAWRRLVGNDDNKRLAFVAVGGYGRGELHPASDIDIMILAADEPDAATIAQIESLLTFLWDVGLEIGHSVRTVAQCRDAAEDITVTTALMEARLLDGDADLFAEMAAAVSPDVTWDSKAFFAAKYQEQQDRHEKFNFTAHQLEPHVKEGPGGLRDIQTIAWVARRHFGTDSLRDLVDRRFLTEEEFGKLIDGMHFLWRIRFALHCQSRRREERLLFDTQLRLAEQFGYSDADHGRAVEQFMQHYYRTVTELSRLNEMLLELFEEDILLEIDEEPEPLNARFRVRNGFLETTSDNIFRETPSALLELFLLLQQYPQVKGVSPSTIRLVRRDRELIDEDFRKDPRNRKLFMRILCEPQGVTHELRRMNRYGILGRYIPAFGNITGRMQFDLFHAYTVDEHILFVVSNLRRFALHRYDREFPFCSALMQKQNKPELLYLAGLFHDIAKGRGGDHSELGAIDAEDFCIEHGLSRYDARLVAWLVKHHLLLSVTAQKKDISDPQVIHEFAQTIGDQLHLDCLYLLTVADVRGTNPELWNSWKARLFRDLYEATRKALLRGLENPIDQEELISDTKDEVMALLAHSGRDVRPLTEFWKSLNEEYFLRHSAEEIAWHATILLEESKEDIILRLRRHADTSGTAVFIATNDDGSLFAQVTAVLDQMGLNIVDARIVLVGEGRSMHTYTVLEDSGEPITEKEREIEIRRALLRSIGSDNKPMHVARRIPRQARMFDTPLRIGFTQDEQNRRTVLEIIAADRPGLLSEIGRIFTDCGIYLHNAKIATVGERAEDVFFITDHLGHPITDEATLEDISRRLRERLGQERESQY